MNAAITPLLVDDRSAAIDLEIATGGKQLAMFLLAIGARTQAETAAAFAAHPEWAAA